MTSQNPNPIIPSSLRWAALGLILLAGAALRTIDLEHVPYGLWFDEAINGMDAIHVWQPGGHFKMFYGEDIGFPREPMYQTGLDLVVRVFGPRVVVLRAYSAALGLATIVLLYLFARRWLGEAEGLAAAGVLATLRWHAIFSRLSFRTLILGPWMLGLVWAALALARKRTAGRAALLGFFIGGGFYTYLAWWFMLPVVAGMVAWIFWREIRTRRGRGLFGVMVLAAALTYLPMGIFFYRHADIVLKRPGAVSVFSNGMGNAVREIARNARDAALMFHWKGDHVPLQNIPWRPALDAAQGVFFAIGLWLAVREIRRGGERRPIAAILLAWLGCGLMTTVMTHTDSPNFLRTQCLTPVAAMLTGLGLAWAGGLAARRWGWRAGVGLVLVMLCASGAKAAWDIYGVWSRRPDVWQNLRGELADMAGAAAQSPADVAVMVPADLFHDVVFEFQAAELKNVYPYSDWQTLLGPWPREREQDGKPRPRKRWIIVTANNMLMEPIAKLAPEAAVVRQFVNPMHDNTWAVMMSVPETGLPDVETLQKTQRDWKREMTF